MAFLSTTVTDKDDLLNQLYTFLDSGGGDGTWTGEFNDAAGTERHIAVTKGNCSVAIGSRTGDVVTKTGTPGGAEDLFNMALATSIDTSFKVYFGDVGVGHPGSLVTTEADNDRIKINDLGATINNAWFFTGTTPVSYCHVVIQIAGDRYTHFSFGIIDPLEQTHTACSYACGTFHQWWDSGATGNNDPSDTDHKIGYFGEDGAGIHTRITDSSVLPIGFGPTAGIYNGNYLTDNMNRVIDPEDHYSNSNVSPHGINDFFMGMDNQAVTGGTAMYALPILFGEDTSPNTGVWLGNLPDVKLINILSHAPGATLDFGSEEWLVFPLKRKGALDEVQGGANAQDAPNTSKLGLAYKKIV